MLLLSKAPSTILPPVLVPPLIPPLLVLCGDVDVRSEEGVSRCPAPRDEKLPVLPPPAVAVVGGGTLSGLGRGRDFKDNDDGMARGGGSKAWFRDATSLIFFFSEMKLKRLLFLILLLFPCLLESMTTVSSFLLLSPSSSPSPVTARRGDGDGDGILLLPLASASSYSLFSLSPSCLLPLSVAVVCDAFLIVIILGICGGFRCCFLEEKERNEAVVTGVLHDPTSLPTPRPCLPSPPSGYK
mmetsp:Transcript_22957/g.36881  ORF Transcript_22957/g.36881 Transcript_22957/m.36881 type:complete len:241 (+) Transcript_22957:502-1224(+)